MSKGVSTSRSTHIADSGGHFYRSDFQVHTPRDTQWQGDRPQDAAGRKAWAEDFVAAARKKDLHAVAISDHHDFAYFPYVKAAATAETDELGVPLVEKERLVVFPALELSLMVPCQAIMILDADFPENQLDDVLKALHFVPVDPDLEMLPQTDNLEDSGDINDLHAKLDKNTWLRGRYIILPNVSPGGYRTLMRKQFQGKYKEMIPVGGYLDGSIEQINNKKHMGDKKILDGEVAAWGSKRLALFPTSDSRSSDFAKLGEHSAWVKWTEPTAEAIRQACLAQESRVAHAEPEMPNIWISKVVVSQSKFMGRVEVALNPQFTALIGGRGAGKSTVLDYLRWALCDQPAQTTDDDEVADPRVRQRKLIEATLKPLGATVEVNCLINGIPHIVRRQAEDGSVFLKVGEGEFEKTREANIQSLLPVQAYSQKQLSSVAIRASELLRFVKSPIHAQLEGIDRRQREVSGRLRENFGKLGRHRVLKAEVERSDLRVRSIGDQAQALRDGLAGISDEDRATLDAKVGHDIARDSATDWHNAIVSAQERLQDLVADVESVLESLVVAGPLPDDIAVEGESVLKAGREALSRVRDALRAVDSDVQGNLSDGGVINRVETALDAKLEAFEVKYAQVKQRSSAHEAKLAVLAQLEGQQREARDLAQSQRKELEALGDPEQIQSQFRTEFVTIRQERTAALKGQCDALSESSEGLIRAVLSVASGFDAARERLKGMIVGSNVRGSRIEELFDHLGNETDPGATWELVLTELDLLAQLESDSELTSERTPTLSRLGLPLADQKKIATRITPDGWLDLSLVELADSPKFEYQAKAGSYIPFASASAGQQASALLSTLLAQAGSPLIVDQPEDDLDSDTVQRIVKKIWQSKSRRQLLFASHNANLVVNGDADLVLVCAYVNAGDQSSGHIKLQGAIDVAGVRNEITAVMEGGEKAFRLRKEKYGF